MANAQQVQVMIDDDYANGTAYLKRLFKTVAPTCEPFPTLTGLATQIDNYIAGLLHDLKRHPLSARVYDEAISQEDIDAAYARHCEPKPVLVWDDDEHCSRSHHGDATYLVTSTRTTAIKFWFAHVVNHRAEVVPLFGGERYTERDEAKAACERHARGE